MERGEGIVETESFLPCSSKISFQIAYYSLFDINMFREGDILLSQTHPWLLPFQGKPFCAIFSFI